MQTLAQIRQLLESRSLAPRKALGQNFLIDHNLIRKLVDAANVHPGDLVLEVGPGTGTLTEELLTRGCRVVACELDHGLAALLRERLADPQSSLGAPAQARFTLIEGDALAHKRALNPDILHALAAHATPPAPSGTLPPFKLIANLPYGAATPIMLALLTLHPQCRGMFVTIQREVADRLLAQPGTADYGPLAVVTQAVADITRLATLPPECFWPRPDVTSAMVAITPKTYPLTNDPARLADAAQHLFTRRRKQLGAILGRNFEFPEGIDPQLRAEALSIPQILALTRKMG